ncbi:MAG: hypothetical protein ACI86M_000823 [Saprospiraceae bacterium]|jgi:hypothetical protein
MKKKYLYITFILFTVINVSNSQEICDNGIDDDGDGLIDIQDIQDCTCGLVDDEIIGDFEDMSCCPNAPTNSITGGGINCLDDGWEMATEFAGGADYIHLCGYTALVPFPIPSGSGAIGMGLQPDHSEPIGYCMDYALVVGQSYDLSFYVGFNDTLYPPPSNSYIASPLNFEFVLFGNNSCDNLPASGAGCLEDSGDDWDILTIIPVSGVADSTWLYVSTSFIATDPSIAIAISGSCDFFQANGYDVTYHFIDDFHLTGQFQVPPTQEITISGDCTSGVYVEVPNVGISYQWYLEGIAILGATNYNYQVPFDQQGSYTVTIDYGSSCETLVPVDVLFALDVLDVSGTAEDITCFGEVDGNIISTVNPDVNMPLDYDWSNSESTPNIDNLVEGNYYLTVTDSNGCYGSTSFTITEPPEMIVNLFITQGNGSDPAQGEVIITGGSPNYDITWCNFDTNNQTNLLPGLCSVTITDASGCEQTFNFEIFEPLDVVVITDYGSCADSCDSEIMLNITGGDSPYSVMWNISGSGIIQSGLCDDLYAYTVIDDYGTEVTGTIDLISEESSLSITAMYDSLVCIGSDLNTISLSTSGGEGPYSYNWSTQDSTAMVDSLPAGIYTVLVTDSLGCTAVDTIELLHYDSLTLTSSITPASCGAANGSIDISILDTVNIHSFNWSNSETTEDINGLLAGNYTLTFVDEFSCMHSYEFEVISDSDLMVTSVVNHENCAGSTDGDITLTITGGTVPYIITWDDTTEDNPKENLTSGTYGVTVTDNNGCIWTDNIVIQTLSQLEISDSIQRNSCSGINDGSIDISIEVGTASNYEWSNSETTEDISGLSEGTYELTITDEYGCEYTYTYEVEIEPPYEVVATIENNNCVGDSTGSIALTIIGGTSPFEILWNTGETTEDLVNLAAGEYSYILQDSFSCIYVDTFTIESFEESAFTILDIICADDLVTYSVEYTIDGASYPYNINGQIINEGESIDLTANSGDSLVIQVLDANLCEIYDETLFYSCDCESEPGQMDENLIELCFEETLTVLPSSGSNVAESDSLVYVLHTSSDSTIGDILAVSDVGEFSFNTLLMSYNTTYYVSSVVFNGSAFNIFVLDEVCTIASAGTPVLWFPENIVELPGSLAFCEDEEIEITVNYSGVVPMTVSLLDGSGNSFYVTMTEEGESTFIIDLTESSVLIVDGYFGISCSLDVMGELEIELNDLPQVEFTTDNVICNSSESGSIIVLDDLISTSNTDGSWYDPDGSIVIGEVDFDGFLEGVYIIQFITSGNSPCEEIIYDIPILVEDCDCPMDIFLPFDGLCQGEYLINLNEYLNPGFVGLGSWSVTTIGGTGDLGLLGSDLTIEESNVGIYQVSYTFDEVPQGCDDEYTFELEIGQLFSAGTALYLDPIEFCIGDLLEIILFDYLVDYEEGGAWNSQNGLPIDILTGLVDLASAEGGLYTFEYEIPENEFCPASTTDVSILIHEPLELFLSILDPLCFGLNDGSVSVEDITGTQIEFNLFNSDQEIISNPDSLFAGDYELNVVDENGCVIVENFTLIDPLELFLDLGDDRVIEEEVTTISPVINFAGDDISLFQWFANQANLDNPTFDTLLISPDGETNVQLIITDEDGCIVADDLLLTVISNEVPVVLANVFNPLNSTFGIEPFEEITLVNEFSIFDRWGSRIFEEKEFTPDDHSKRWDGTFNGTIVNNGVYVFAIYYTDQVGKIISIYGDVAVIR